ncbi:hypothetical protein Y032_0051g2148 [Ancylostoma ceylanicum]|nr:hypothetical protein Y032_0051g2148 [Ancylostoma ceylanicum]
MSAFVFVEVCGYICGPISLVSNVLLLITIRNTNSRHLVQYNVPLSLIALSDILLSATFLLCQPCVIVKDDIALVILLGPATFIHPAFATVCLVIFKATLVLCTLQVASLYAFKMLAQKWHCRVPTSACYVSFDAVSLYTNIDNNAAVKALLELLNNHSKEVSMWGFSNNDIEILLEATLACNVFRFNNTFYAQKRGLAMGIRIAPLLAIVFLDHIEKASLTNGIIFYKRYIDDVFAIGSSFSVVTSTLAKLNSMDVNIRFTMEEPGKDGFLPFLNTRVRFCNGRSEIRWHRKASSKNIMLHSRSAHPTYMKVNVARNLKKTSERIAANDEESDKMIRRILSENGYKDGSMNTWRPHSAPDGIALVLPYVNEHISKQVNIVVKRSGLPVRLIFRPPPTLREILTSSRIYESRCDIEDCQYCTDRKICHLRGTVYMITCSTCGQRYIGETGRPLRERLNEHRRALTSPQSYPTNSFSRHRTAVHTREPPPLLEVTVLHRHLEHPVERKIMEAREIKRHRPEINSRDELAETITLIA